MSERAAAAERMARVRRQMARLADLRRAQAERAVQAAADARADLERFSASVQPTGPLARTVLAQDGRLAERQAAATAALARAMTTAQDGQRQLKTAEKLAARLTREAAALAERRSLERLIEDGIGRGAASLP